MKIELLAADDIARRKEALVARWGAWSTSNMRLAEGLYTIGEGAPGDERRVRRAVQTVRDLAGGTVSGLRILDLGCGEGALALELGRHGADVLALDGRLAHVEKGEFAREVFGIRSVSFVRADARRLSAEEHGFFDIVVALSLLDHLDATDFVGVLHRIAAVCKRFALVESRIVPRARASREAEGFTLRGALRREHPPTSSRAQRLAALDRSLDNDASFVPTRLSLLQLLAWSGFTSTAEILDPDASAEAPWLAAFKGRRVALQTAPQANALVPSEWKDPSPRAARPVIGRLLRRPKR